MNLGGGTMKISRRTWLLILGIGLSGCAPLERCAVGVAKEDCMYLAVWDPVCGCDRVTYSNAGEAGCHDIEEYTYGECR